MANDFVLVLVLAARVDSPPFCACLNFLVDDVPGTA
eukprot:COSAG02_NODE_24124_length_697_cov_0.998328_1_plen_35_part_01